MMPFKTLLAALAFGLAAGAAPAADYPDRPIRLVVPVTPGGPNDIFARTLQPRLGALLGQQVLVENVPGAGGNIAVNQVARQPRDGYNLILHGMTYAVNPSIFGPERSYRIGEFVPVSIVAKGPLVLVAHPSLGVRSAAELVALIKSRPNGIDYASGGPGTSPHLAAELFKQLSGAAGLQHVPYKGTSAFMPDLLAGRVPVAFVSPLVVKPYIEAGKLVGLGVTSAKRSPGWDLPTVAESGVPGYDFDAWYTILVAAGTPQPVIDKLNRVVAEAIASPEAQQKWQSLGVEVMPGDAKAAADYLMAEYAKWAKVVKAANITAE